MNPKAEYSTEGGSIIFSIKKDEVSVVSCQVREARFVIPDAVEGKPVTEIEKKAILSNKTVKELVLPAGLKTVGDWAFAHCSNLQTVWMPCGQIQFGRGVFKDCLQLTDICLKSVAEEQNLKFSKLLGAVPVKLNSDYLLNPAEAGTKVWLEMFDARLLTLLQKPDQEGYSRQVLCGEEDLMANLEVYISDCRKEKAELCFLRLLHRTGLSRELKEVLERFLRENTKGCEYEAAWKIVYRKHASEQSYYRIFTETGCVTEENFDLLLMDLGDRHPEMTAYLLRYRKEHMAAADFFDAFSLD